MREQTSKLFTRCINFKHCCLISALVISFSSSAEKRNLFEQFNPNYRIQERSPQSFLPDTEYVPAPERKEMWLEKVFVEDDAGVLISIKRDFNSWSETEDYVHAWDLESTGLYELKDEEEKRKYFGKRMLKYLDKRVSGEIKKADKGSTLHQVGQVQKALKPNTKVDVNKYIKLRFKARVLQGKAIMKIENPYVEADTTYKITRGLQMNLAKKIDVIGVLAKVEYKPTKNEINAILSKRVNPYVTTEVSSGTEESRFSLSFSAPFNY